MADRPNLLLVTVDSLRRDALGCLDSNGGPTPALDRLAAEGTLFTDAVSNGPRTPSAFPAILCSLHPLVSGETGLPPGAATLAEALQGAGYRTAGFNLDNPYIDAIHLSGDTPFQACLPRSGGTYARLKLLDCGDSFLQLELGWHISAQRCIRSRSSPSWRSGPGGRWPSSVSPRKSAKVMATWGGRKRLPSRPS